MLRKEYTEKTLLILNAIKVAFFYKKYTFMCKTSSIYVAAYQGCDFKEYEYFLNTNTHSCFLKNKKYEYIFLFLKCYKIQIF